MNWQKVTAAHPYRHVVYWHVILPDGRRGSVGRIYNDDGSFTPGGPWRWTIWNKQGDHGRGIPDIQGVVNTVGAGKARVRTAYFKGGMS